jgi:hypothetical protein
MAEVFVRFTEPITSRDGMPYYPCVCGRKDSIGRWEAWIEFEPVHGGQTLRSARETVQPNRTDVSYWAGGLTRVYLQGALDRAHAVTHRNGHG